MDKILIIILLGVHFIMTINLTVYLFMDHLKIVGKGAYWDIPLVIVISNLWLIYWCWFVYADVRPSGN